MNKTLISILGGLGGMFGWGTSDFLANSASDKIGHTRAFFWSQIIGLALIFFLIFFTLPSFIFTPLLLGLTVCGSIAYAFAYLLLYKGFEIGNVSVVSAVINLYAVFVVLISFFIRGQRLSIIQVPAIVLILLGVTLVAVNFNDFRQKTISLMLGVKETLLSSVIFGVFFWPLNEYIVEKMYWLPVSLVTKSTAVSTVFLFAFFQKQSLTVSKTNRKILLVLVAIGLLEAVGTLSVTIGQSYGDGIIVTPISSALTIVTVSLAIIFLRERITKVQGLGILLTIMGIILTAF